MPTRSPHGLDRTAFSVVSLAEQDRDDRRYWLSRTPHERLQAVETIRRALYGYDPSTERLQRVLEVGRLTDLDDLDRLG